VRRITMSERESKALTAGDIRFTIRDGVLYAIALGCPESGQLRIASLAAGQAPGSITSITLLGHDGALQWTRDERGLSIRLPETGPGDHAFAFRIISAP